MANYLKILATTNTVTVPGVSLPAADWSLEVKFRVPAGTTGEVVVFGEESNTNNRFYVNFTTGIISFRSAGTAYNSAASGITAGAANTVLWQRVGTQTRIYLNGSLVTTLGYVVAMATPFTRIGSSGASRPRVDIYFVKIVSVSLNRDWNANGVTSGTRFPELIGVDDADDGILTNFAGNPWEAEPSILTLTTLMVPGEAFSGTCEGYADGAATLSHSSISIAVTIASGAFSGTVPAITDAILYPFLPVTGATWTLTQSALTAPIGRTLTTPTGYDVCRNVSGDPVNFTAIQNDPTTLQSAFAAAGNSLTTSDRGLYPTANGLIVYPDSRTEVDTVPHVFDMIIQRASGYSYIHEFELDEDGEVVVPEITSVGTVRIGGTTPITVANFASPVTAGTLDGVALVLASNTSITADSITDGEAFARPGTRELELTGGVSTASANVPVLPPDGWGSYVITSSFVEAINGVASSYLPVGADDGYFILYPLVPSAGKITAVSDLGVVTSNVGTQELFLGHPTTGVATAFDIVTSAGAGTSTVGVASGFRPFAFTPFSMESV